MPRQDPGRPWARPLFFNTPSQRVALARQQLFEEGQRPSGLVPEGVLQSWLRCLRQEPRTSRTLSFDPVTPSRLHGALNRNRPLLSASGEELQSLEHALSGTDCRVILTDSDGVIVHVTHHPLADQPLLGVAARLGVNLSESAVGTTAPGLVTHTGQACSVMGAEHDYDCLQSFHCAAAPIRDIHGHLAGVLDLSIETRPFGFDAASLVGAYATAIENRLLKTQAREQLVLQFQAHPDLLDSVQQGLAGIDDQGRLAWVNPAGRRLLGLAPKPTHDDFDAMLGLDLADLLGLSHHAQPQPRRLSNGLTVWLRVRLQAADGLRRLQAVGELARPPAQAPEPPADACADHSPPAAAARPPLHEHSRQHIEAALAQAGGNITRAARALGVSRGLLYRRLKSRNPPSGPA